MRGILCCRDTLHFVSSDKNIIKNEQRFAEIGLEMIEDLFNEKKKYVKTAIGMLNREFIKNVKKEFIKKVGNKAEKLKGMSYKKITKDVFNPIMGSKDFAAYTAKDKPGKRPLRDYSEWLADFDAAKYDEVKNNLNLGCFFFMFGVMVCVCFGGLQMKIVVVLTYFFMGK